VYFAKQLSKLVIILMGIIWIIKKVIYFISKRGQNSEISCILKVYIIFRFFIKILYVFLIDFAENFPLYVDRFPPSHRVKQIKLLDQMGQIPKFWVCLILLFQASVPF
jgi:uncharacterized membrane protein